MRRVMGREASRHAADLRRTSRRAWLALGVLASGVAAGVVAGTMVEPGRSTPAGAYGPAGSGNVAPEPTWAGGAGTLPTSALPPSGPPTSGLPTSGLPTSGLPPSGLPTSTLPTSAGADPAADRYAFPVDGKASYARSHHDYPATDIIAGCGSAVRAVHGGVVLEVSRTDTYRAETDDGAARGGLFVSMLGDDGVRYYHSHLSAVTVGIDAGARVRVGQPLGSVGDTGHAGVCHLHFGLSPPCAGVGDWWVRRGAVWPWSYLDSWRRGVPSSPAVAVAAWWRTHGCPGQP
jgi:murein DD-endopeptidase MepM/ murein hydrolase activator NlpD